MPQIVPIAIFNKRKIIPWIILFFSALNVIFLGGKRRGFGSYVAQLRKDFPNVTLMELNWVGDSYSAIGYVTSGLSTTLILNFDRRYGIFQFVGGTFVLVSCLCSSFVPNPHWLFLSHSFVHGVGSSLIFACVGLVVNEHFGLQHEYHLLATTLISGGSIASILFVPFFAFLIKTYTWRISFLILGGIYFVVHTLASFIFRRNEQLTDDNTTKKLTCSMEGVTMMQVPLLVLWFIDRVITTVVTYGLLLNLTDYVHRFQADLLESTALTTLFAAGEGTTYLIGAVTTALTKNMLKHKFGIILLTGAFLGGTSLMIMEFTRDSAIASKVLCYLSGLFTGTAISFLFPASEELTRLPGHIAYPFSLAGMGTGMLLSPLFSAKVAEAYQYRWFFFVQACLLYVKAFCLLLIILLLFYYSKCAKDRHLTDLWCSEDEIEVKKEPFPKESTHLLSDKVKQ